MNKIDLMISIGGTMALIFFALFFLSLGLTIPSPEAQLNKSIEIITPWNTNNNNNISNVTAINQQQ